MAGGNRVKQKGAFCGPRPPRVLARSSSIFWGIQVANRKATRCLSIDTRRVRVASDAISPCHSPIQRLLLEHHPEISLANPAFQHGPSGSLV